MTILPMAKYVTIPGEPNRMSIAPRNVWFVDSAVDDSSGLTPETAFGTVNEATDAASAGDTVVLMPYHSETIATAAAWNPDVAGVRYLGLGHGDSRPHIQLSANLSTVEFDADDQWFENIIFEGTFASGVAVGLDVKTGCDDLMFKDCVIRGTTTDKELLVGVSIEATNDRITFDGCFFYEFAGTATSALVCEGAYTNLRIIDTEFVGTWSAGAIDCETTAVTTQALYMRDVTIVSHGAADGLCILSTDTSVNQFLRVNTFAIEANQLPLAANDDGATTANQCFGTDSPGLYGLIWPSAATVWT